MHMILSRSFEICHLCSTYGVRVTFSWTQCTTEQTSINKGIFERADVTNSIMSFSP